MLTLAASFSSLGNLPNSASSQGLWTRLAPTELLNVSRVPLAGACVALGSLCMGSHFFWRFLPLLLGYSPQIFSATPCQPSSARSLFRGYP